MSRAATSRYAAVAVVIPALNEERSLPRVLADLPAVGAVIVVDNGSDDRTAEVAAAAGARVVSAPTRGYGRACQAGIAKAAAFNPQILVILDADFSDDPRELPLLVDPILNGEADLVMGDRTALADSGALPPHQVFGNRLATMLIWATSGLKTRDMGPFRAIRWEALTALHMRDPTYGWNVEMSLKAARAGLRVSEVPVHYRERIGTSKISGTIRGSLRAGFAILRAVRRYA